MTRHASTKQLFDHLAAIGDFHRPAAAAGEERGILEGVVALLPLQVVADAQRAEIGAFARPEEIRFSDGLPKTRSGKIMRRLLREIVTSNSVSGDVTTLEDLSVLTRLATTPDDES